MDTTLFIFHLGMAYPHLETWALSRSTTLASKPITKLARFLERRRNPRSREYMEYLAKQVFPKFDPRQMVVVGPDRQLPIVDWNVVENVVLLWPDANGTGWAYIVRQVFRRKSPSTGVFVLNGRRRFFVLQRMTWAGFTWRSFLERTLAVELGGMLVFVVVTPWLVLWDLWRGRS